ncbi:Preprotein translocase subunit SecE [Lactococcus garvieae DCC43]|nr:Preprotein translocase subunit SecE [Lactococcus garvieae DCC43]
MVIEYTVFFLIFLMIFDWVTQNGITSAVQHLLPFVRN